VREDGLAASHARGEKDKGAWGEVLDEGDEVVDKCVEGDGAGGGV